MAFIIIIKYFIFIFVIIKSFIGFLNTIMKVDYLIIFSLFGLLNDFSSFESIRFLNLFIHLYNFKCNFPFIKLDFRRSIYYLKIYYFY